MYRAPDPDARSDVIPEAQLPWCKRAECRGLVRPHVIWFGECLEEEVLDATLRDFLQVRGVSIVRPARDEEEAELRERLS